VSARAWLDEHPTHASLFIDCPGCGFSHAPAVRGAPPDGAHVWQWNGSLEAPTISPSLLVRAPAYGDPPRDLVCHSFIRDGRIQFLSDCTHSLAGQTVDLPPVEP